ncbi:MAG TPA: ATP-binding cassette domain-containing protein [Ktedonobacterales bacterium]|jgi:zinc/manganese transport system ATP-binding protein
MIASQSAIALEQVSVRLGGRLIWGAASASISAGEFVVVLGPNGAGKSTLLRLLLGLVKPATGRVMVFGEAAPRGNSAIGYIPQRRNIESGAAVRGRDLVALGLDGHRWGVALPGKRSQQAHAQVDDIIDAVGASAYADRPLGQLSGGERQRLLLAQALVSQPRLLLLDEPLASLDMRSQLTTTQVIGSLARARGITTLLVAHDVNPLLGELDRVLYIARGGVAIGTPDEIITTQRLSTLYDAPVEVIRDARGRIFVVSMDGAPARP